MALPCFATQVLETLIGRQVAALNVTPKTVKHREWQTHPNSRAMPANSSIFQTRYLNPRDCPMRAKFGNSAAAPYRDTTNKCHTNFCRVTGSPPVVAILAKFLQQIEIFTATTTPCPETTLIYKKQKLRLFFALIHKHKILTVTMLQFSILYIGRISSSCK